VFDALAAVAVVGLASFGVLIAFSIFPAVLGVPKYGTEGTWNEPYAECNEDYLASIGHITEKGTQSRPPRGYWFNSTSEDWAADVCTEAQRFFTMCVKGFTFIFSYINFLPIPWRLSIFNEAFFGRPMMDDELKVGCDFYGRPTEALWFHLPRAPRKKVTVLLNLAWVTHFASQIGHLVYWTHAQGQSIEGTLAQNIPFVMSIVSGIAAGVIQGSAEKTTMAANPGRFPPKYDAWIRTAISDAILRYRDYQGTGSRRIYICICCSRSFWKLLMEEMKDKNETYKEEVTAKGGAAHGLTGINLHGSTKALAIKDADGTFDEIAGKGATHVTLPALTDYMVKRGLASKGQVAGVYHAANTNKDADGIDRVEWRVAFAAGKIPGMKTISATTAHTSSHRLSTGPDNT